MNIAWYYLLLYLSDNLSFQNLQVFDDSRFCSTNTETLIDETQF